jgi:hypothetical protein
LAIYRQGVQGLYWIVAMAVEAGGEECKFRGGFGNRRVETAELAG